MIFLQISKNLGENNDFQPAVYLSSERGGHSSREEDPDISGLSDDKDLQRGLGVSLLRKQPEISFIYV